MSATSKSSSVAPTRSDFILRLGRAQMWLAAAAIVAMMLVTVVDVVMRYAFNNPVRGAYDFTEAMLVVFAFHGMAACFVARTNIVIDLIDGFIGAPFKRFLQRLADLVSLGLLLVLTYAAWKPAFQAFGNGETKLQLSLPIWMLWAVALVGLVGTVVCAAWLLAKPLGALPVAGSS